MEIRQEFVVDRDIATVWAALSDIHLVASCMPGAEIVSVSDDQSEVEGRLRTRIGPISAAFGGRGRIVRDEDAFSGSVEGTGSDRSSGSRAQLKLAYSLTPNGSSASTKTSVVAGIVLSGPLAQFGKGALINDIATHMTQEFSRNLGQRLAVASASQDGMTQPRPLPLQGGAGELKPMRLLWAVVKTRLARLFKWITR